MHLASHEITVGTKRSEWVVRLFTDDLEDAISASLGGTKVRLERPEGRSQTENYVRSKLTVLRGRKAQLARRQIAAFDEAIAKGQAVAVVDGKIVENLHIVTARATLAKAEAIAALEG